MDNAERPAGACGTIDDATQVVGGPWVDPIATFSNILGVLPCFDPQHRLAALGEQVAERAGVINLGLEGAIIAGCLGALVAGGAGGPALGPAWIANRYSPSSGTPTSRASSSTATATTTGTAAADR